MRRDNAATLVELNRESPDLESLRDLMAGVAAIDPVLVLHLVGDRDSSPTPDPKRDLQSDLSAHTTKLNADLSVRFAGIDIRTWIINTTGSEFDQDEQDFLDTVLKSVEPDVRGLIVPSATRASIAHSASDVEAHVADIIHILATVSPQEFESGNDRTWAVGVGSVIFEPACLNRAVGRELTPRLERILTPNAKDPGRDEGQRWLHETGILPLRPGQVGDDAEERLLRTGPGAGSIRSTPGRWLRVLDSDLEGMDPGLWAGYIAHSVDQIMAPRTDVSATPSPLATAFEQIDAGIAVRLVNIQQELEFAMRERIETQVNLPTARIWCEGVRELAEKGIESLKHFNGDNEPIDLRAKYDQLAIAARKLPRSSALLSRGIVVVVMLLVISYAYAPATTLLTWALSRRMHWFGDNLETNAQIWARITAVTATGSLWLWWEAKWRRVRRFRRLYIKAANVQIMRLVDEHLRRSRITLLQALIDAIGNTTSTANELYAWITRCETALRSILDKSNDSTESHAITETKWSKVIPQPDELGSAVTFEENELGLMDELPVKVLTRAPLETTADQMETNFNAEIRMIFAGSPIDLASYWNERMPLHDRCTKVLTAELRPNWSGTGSHEVEGRHYLVAHPTTIDIIKAVTADDHNHGDLSSSDTCFVANLWLRPINLHAPSNKAPRNTKDQPIPDETPSNPGDD